MPKLRPMPGWVLCRALEESKKSTGGVLLPTSADDNVTSEGVAEVIAVTPKRGLEPPFSPGDKIVYRGFLRFCNQAGHLFEEHRACKYFILNIDDALAVVSDCRIGLYGEFEV